MTEVLGPCRVLVPSTGPEEHRSRLSASGAFQFLQLPACRRAAFFRRNGQQYAGLLAVFSDAFTRDVAIGKRDRSRCAACLERGPELVCRWLPVPARGRRLRRCVLRGSGETRLGGWCGRGTSRDNMQGRQGRFLKWRLGIAWRSRRCRREVEGIFRRAASRSTSFQLGRGRRTWGRASCIGNGAERGRRCFRDSFFCCARRGKSPRLTASRGTGALLMNAEDGRSYEGCCSDSDKDPANKPPA